MGNFFVVLREILGSTPIQQRPIPYCECFCRIRTNVQQTTFWLSLLSTHGAHQGEIVQVNGVPSLLRWEERLPKDLSVAQISYSFLKYASTKYFESDIQFYLAAVEQTDNN